jgi:hypothetical protein
MFATPGDTAETPPATPINAQISTSGDFVTLSWDMVESANSYKVYSAVSPAGTFMQVSGNQSEFSINENRVSWTQALTEPMKFYYVTSSTDAEVRTVRRSK